LILSSEGFGFIVQRIFFWYQVAYLNYLEVNTSP
jgi:hypothetical protein